MPQDEDLNFLTGGKLQSPPHNINTRTNTKGVEVVIKETEGIQKTGNIDLSGDLVTIESIQDRNLKKVTNNQTFPRITNTGAILTASGFIGILLITALLIRR